MHKGDHAILDRIDEDSPRFAPALSRAAHDLMPSYIASEVPPLYGQDGKGDDAIVYVKLFTPDSSWTWFITEYDPKRNHAFGLVDGHEEEIGYIDLNELRTTRGHFGLYVERDLHWTPKPLGECRRRGRRVPITSPEDRAAIASFDLA